jgi:hypothetical protein
MSRFSPGLISGGLDQYTKVLLHMDGSNGSTSFVDAATPSRVWTAGGGAALTTAGSKFGGASGNFGGWVDTPDHADFALGTDWTIDCWINAGGAGTARTIFGQTDSTNSIASLSIYATASSADQLVVTYGTPGSFGSFAGGSIGGGWQHIAVIRSGGTLYSFVDGSLANTSAFGGTITNSSAKFAVGRAGELASTPFNGWIDEFRLSVGIARWTSGFTPPTAPY